tara:strand:+ start:16913 stop:17707 length:795 start_codon:yes stop_codon:yes gene_type:complete
MIQSFQKEVLQESDYSKYLEELKTYYNMKKTYIKTKETVINKLINSNDSIESKKKIFSKQKFKCINCGEFGGTIFFENNKILRATCGNTIKPCNLNLEIIKMNPVLITSELKNTNNSLINKKKEIILTKLDFLFNYIEEDKAVELFENLKSELTTLQEKYNDLFSLYTSIVSNPDNEELLNQKIIEIDSLVNNFKEYIKLFKETEETSYLKDAIFLYTSKIKSLNEYISTLKYKYNSIESDETYKYLIQNKYNIKNLELIKKPQ